MSAREFLDHLEKLGLLDDSVTANLRQQLEGASSRVTAESLAKLLVEGGHLTRFQATKLVNEVTAATEQRRAKQADVDAKRKQQAAPKPKRAAEEDLGFAPLPGETPPAKPAAGPKGTPTERRKAPAAAPAAPPAKPAPRAGGNVDELIAGAVEEVVPPKKRPAFKTSEAPPAAAAPAAPAPVAVEVAPELSALPAEPLAVAEPAGFGALDDVAPPPTGGFQKKKARSNPWDSPLILVGSFVLVLLVVLTGVLYMSLTRGTAAEYFKLAEEDYRGGSYLNAIAQYEKFLSNYPRDPNAPLARVRKSMAQLRIEAEGVREPQKALAAAQRILPDIENESMFSEAREELATLLPDIARAFADRARKAPNPDDAEKLLGSVKQAMELVNNASYIPTTLRKTQAGVIETIEETVAQVRRDIDRDRQLALAVSAMAKAIEDGNTREAFRVRDELLASYPGLEAHPEVVKKVAEIAERERDLIQVVAQSVAPVVEDAATAGAKIVLYSRAGEGVPGVSEETTLVVVNGAVYALDAGTGRVLWRRFVGADAPVSTVRVGSEPNADRLLVDSARHELVRVEARTGKVVWRLPVGEPFHGPRIWRDRVLLTTASGLVLDVELASGTSERRTSLKQALSVALGSDDKYGVFYQVGENDNLYAVSVDSMECREVLYLGHRKGTVAVPPVVAVGHLFVAVNGGADFSFVHAFGLDENGLSLKRVQEPIRLDGHVVAPPVVAGRRIIFTTSLGAVAALEINPQKQPPITQEFAPLPVARATPMLTYALVDSSGLWLADQRLAAYDVQASQGQFVRRWVSFDTEDFVAPLQKAGDAIVSVRRAAGSEGYRIAAVDGETGKKVYWQLNLAFPTLRLTAGPDNRLLAISSLGSVFAVAPATTQAGIVEGVADLRLGGQSFDTALPLADGRQVIFSRSGQALIYDPARPDQEMRLLRLNVADGGVASDPILLGDGLLVPQRTGQISLLNVNSGDNLVLPFQPRIQAGTEIAWRSPVAAAGETREFVIADDRQNLYRVGVVETGGAHMDALEQVTVNEQLSTTGAVLGNTLFATTARSDADALLCFTLPRLKAEAPIDLPGRVVWGPFAAGDLVMLATDASGLLAFDANRNRRWTSPLTYGPLAGPPLVVDGDVLLASQAGTVWRISGAEGKEVAKHGVGEPLGGAPVPVGDLLWVPGADGTLFFVPMLKP